MLQSDIILRPCYSLIQWGITCFHSGLSATSELYPFFIWPGVVTSVQLWFCGWDKKQIQAAPTLTDLISPCPPLESWISCLRRHVKSRVYFLWTWFHEDEWRRYCPLLPHRACSCSPTQYTQKLPRDEKLSRMLSFTNERPPSIFLPVTWENASPPLFSFLLSSSSSQSGSIHSSQSIC